MKPSLHSTLSTLIADISDQARAALVTTDVIPQADMERFVAQCKTLLDAFVAVVEHGSTSRSSRAYAIRNLSEDVEAQYENARTYISRLEVIYGPRMAS